VDETERSITKQEVGGVADHIRRRVWTEIQSNWMAQRLSAVDRERQARHRATVFYIIYHD
jgi:hypothetical protein